MQSHYQPGDIVARRKGLVMHKGVVLEDGRILHNTPWRGEHVSSEREFRVGRRLRVTAVGSQKRRRVLGAATEGERGYNLFTNNCEHTVNRMTTGRASSPQLKGWIAGAAVAALAVAVLRNPVLVASAYAVGRGLVKSLRARKSSKVNAI